MTHPRLQAEMSALLGDDDATAEDAAERMAAWIHEIPLALAGACAPFSVPALNAFIAIAERGLAFGADLSDDNHYKEATILAVRCARIAITVQHAIAEACRDLPHFDLSEEDDT